MRSLTRVTVLSMLLAAACACPVFAVPQRFEKPPHDYWTRPLTDPFTVWLKKVERGEAQVPAGDELTVVRGFLQLFGIPVTSQMLVYSATSRQTVISPYRPRALYFNEEVYFGYVPGGRIEVASIDPLAGPVFYIFNFPKPGPGGFQPDRSDRCMQCHAGHDNHQLPKLVIDSVIVNHEGGSLETWRTEKFGHQVPLEQRFGGWHLTGGHHLGSHHGNTLGRLAGGKLTVLENPPGKLFSMDRFPVPTSDVLPQLLHDHQAGMHNLATEAVYLWRELTDGGRQELNREGVAALDKVCAELADYLLFRDEARLPDRGITGDPDFIRDFQSGVRRDGQGAFLKEFDLKTRLMKHRCSYMIYSRHWTELPAPVKAAAWRHLARLLSDGPEAAPWLPQPERETVTRILRATLPESAPYLRVG